MNMPKLSILICTLTNREALLNRLLEQLKQQCRIYGVQIDINEDQGQMTIGEKRQHLLENAKGEYVCFVDDDDKVSDTYVMEILEALKETPTATHCSLRGIAYSNGSKFCDFEHSTKYKSWSTLSDGLRVRSPNHLNTIRKDLALLAGFPNKSFGEDHDFSDRLVELGCLTTEAWIANVLYEYIITKPMQIMQPIQQTQQTPAVQLRQPFFVYGNWK